ncbi:hypothetical protein EVAR_84476_1 [Eumeta japonica]|uniref:Uncharacterized protein n=1 Tax=Eumeta variegata TaxID=151549 RepID=A0A4C1X849_EUMVA|nr:hypothetical protein EVAR_84476_1 [Eumeta japonica]
MSVDVVLFVFFSVAGLCNFMKPHLKGYTGSSLSPDESVFRRSIQAAPLSPLTNIADRLVVDAIRRASLTRRPSTIKYPPDYFNTQDEPSSSSSEDDKSKKPKMKKLKN